VDQLTALEADWRELESRVSSRMAFGSFDYLVPWYRHMPPSHGTPFVGVVRRSGRVVGIAPLARRTATLGRVPLRRIDSAAHDCDVGEVLFTPDEGAAFESLLESLFERGGFDAVILTGVTPGSWVQQAVRSTAARGSRSLGEIEYRYATVDLRQGYDAYVRGLNSKKRGNLRRRQKRADSMGGTTLDRINRPVDRATLTRYLDRIFTLYERSWKSEDGIAIQEYHRAFYMEVAERFNARSMLDLSILQVGGRDAAFILGLRERDTFFDVTVSYDDEFAPVSPGMLLFQEVARRCASEGVRLLVSHGDREYKRAWASNWVPQTRTMLFAPGLKPALARFARFEVPKLASFVRGLAGKRQNPAIETE
jgi:CelD/BcsL family acetyltransferase involved in cellulose biosynthesis